MMTLKRLSGAVVLVCGLVALNAADTIPADQAARIREAAPARARVAPKRARRVLIWNTPAHLMTQDPHKGYCIPYGAAACETLGRKSRAFEPVISDDLATFLPENLRGFDALVLNNSSGAWITPTAADLKREVFQKHGSESGAIEAALRRSLLSFVREGGGLVSLHYALAANAHWPEFKELMGGTFIGHPWNEEIGVKVEEPTHPLVAAFGGKDFRIADEIYEYGPPWDRARLRVLLSLDPARSNMGVPWIHRTDNDFALAWVKSYGQGRVFNTSFGHRTELFWDPRVLAFYLDAIQFATGDLEAPMAPRSEPAAKASATPSKDGLIRQLWPKERIESALREVERQKADGLLSPAAYQRRQKMLTERLAGRYQPETLAVTDPPLNFIQNAGFEQTNPNSAKDRSRWLWWNGWSWGGDYENQWEDRPECVHSGKLSARIRCVGAPGRMGIFTPPLPVVPKATDYRLTFWARGEGDNMLFVNFEEGVVGTFREKIGEPWRQYNVLGKPAEAKNTYGVYFYATGAGTLWLDDVELVPVGGTLDE